MKTKNVPGVALPRVSQDLAVKCRPPPPEPVTFPSSEGSWPTSHQPRGLSLSRRKQLLSQSSSAAFPGLLPGPGSNRTAEPWDPLAAASGAVSQGLVEKDTRNINVFTGASLLFPHKLPSLDLLQTQNWCFKNVKKKAGFHLPAVPAASPLWPAWSPGQE